MRRASLWLLAAALWSCAARSRRVLFVGNSLTYGNDVPGMVEALAGLDRAEAAMVAHPGFSLDDHLAHGEAMRAIHRGGWSVVVLQQGPSSLPQSRIDLRRATAAFAAEIQRRGARPALYMVWPSAARAADLDQVIESYELAASDVDGLLFPVGRAWPTTALPLYSPDGFHPSIAGSYLAALVIYGRLFHASCVGLPSSFRTRRGQEVQIPPELARSLQEAADAAVGSDP